MEQIFLGRVNVRSWPDPSRYARNAAGLLQPLAHVIGDVAHLHHFVRRSESQAHKRRFDEITAALVAHTRDYFPSDREMGLGIDDKEAQIALDRGIMACQSVDGEVFALDPKDRWLALMVPEGRSPRESARLVEGFLRRLVDDQELRIDVDLVCPPGAILDGIARLSNIAEFQVTIRLPNDPARSLYDAIRQMESVGATEKVDTLRSERGLWLSREEIELLDSAASAGEVDVRVTSVGGEVYDSREDAARFRPPFKVSAELVPISLTLALLWIIQNWPPPSGGLS